MILENGFAKIKGASDLEDSSMAAGLCALLGFLKVDLSYYFDELGYYRRCENSVYTFSRDQFICLSAGLYKQGMGDLVSTDRVTGKDIMPPSVMGHVARCNGRKASWLQDLWLRMEMYVHAKLSPLGESNQLFCMLLVAGPGWVKDYCRMNPHWHTSVTDYWCGWRDEPELAKCIVRKIEEIIL